MNDIKEGITIRGAREHNLKNVDVHIPRNKITVITGLSGSGKSSLAFDTLYAEGQRRYIESLSVYARNFLDQLKKPDVDSIQGLSPAVAIEQKTTSTNPRSTVGTVTELFDSLRLLYAKVGIAKCPTHGIELMGRKADEIVQELLRLPSGTKFHVLAPIVRSRKGEFSTEFQRLLKKGFVRVRIDGTYYDLESAPKLVKTKVHNIELVVDRLIMKPDLRPRLAEAVQTALSLAEGYLMIDDLGKSQLTTYSIKSVCPECQFTFPEIEPRLFSFNNPRGACPTCAGIGVLGLEEDLGVSDKGSDDEEDDELEVDEWALQKCPDCQGTRLRIEARSVDVAGKNIAELSEMPLSELTVFFKKVPLNTRQRAVAEKLLKQIDLKLGCLVRLGVGYLSLHRPTRTLSGGESQRIRIAAQLGSSLVGVLYVLDEPSIGLHPRDHSFLLEVLRELRDLGNTIVLVEHDEDTITSADHIIDVGPRAGVHGGHILCAGSLEEIKKHPDSLTSLYLNGRAHVFQQRKRELNFTEALRIEGATGNNLKNVTLTLPPKALTAVSGVSGSGKSTLIIETLYRVAAHHFYGSSLKPAPYKKIKGLDQYYSVVNIDQKPIGRTPRSNPATYVGLFTMIRDLFSQLPESRIRGYKPGRFSFNVKGGRCESCQGAGQLRVEMHFLADVYVPCDVCQGRRYNRETLLLKYKDKSIFDILQMTVAEAVVFFQHHMLIHRRLETLMRVGLDYLTLGQSSTSLSGGEAQRIKLSRELAKKKFEPALYILDEPTTGLHFHDVRKLIELLHELVDQGHSVVVIEHHIDVLKSADYIIDLGPEGGAAGGEIVCAGRPSEIAKNPRSLTGKFLR